MTRSRTGIATLHLGGPIEVQEDGGILAQALQHAIDRLVVHRVQAAGEGEAFVTLDLDLGPDVDDRFEAQRLSGREADVAHHRRHHRLELRLVHRLAGDARQDRLRGHIDHA